MTNLFLSYTIIWLALFAFMMYLSNKQKKLNRELETLKKLLENKP